MAAPGRSGHTCIRGEGGGAAGGVAACSTRWLPQRTDGAVLGRTAVCGAGDDGRDPARRDKAEPNSAHDDPVDRRATALGRSDPGRKHRGAVTRPTCAADGREGRYRWISPVQAARRLKVSVRDVYRLIDAGALPAYRIDDRIQLLAHEVDELARRPRR